MKRRRTLQIDYTDEHVESASPVQTTSFPNAPRSTTKRSQERHAPTSATLNARSARSTSIHNTKDTSPTMSAFGHIVSHDPNPHYLCFECNSSFTERHLLDEHHCAPGKHARNRVIPAQPPISTEQYRPLDTNRLRAPLFSRGFYLHKTPTPEPQSPSSPTSLQYTEFTTKQLSPGTQQRSLDSLFKTRKRHSLSTPPSAHGTHKLSIVLKTPVITSTPPSGDSTVSQPHPPAGGSSRFASINELSSRAQLKQLNNDDYKYQTVDQQNTAHFRYHHKRFEMALERAQRTSLVSRKRKLLPQNSDSENESPETPSSPLVHHNQSPSQYIPSPLRRHSTAHVSRKIPHSESHHQEYPYSAAVNESLHRPIIENESLLQSDSLLSPYQFREMNEERRRKEAYLHAHQDKLLRRQMKGKKKETNETRAQRLMFEKQRIINEQMSEKMLAIQEAYKALLEKEHEINQHEQQLTRRDQLALPKKQRTLDVYKMKQPSLRRHSDPVKIMDLDLRELERAVESVKVGTVKRSMSHPRRSKPRRKSVGPTLRSAKEKITDDLSNPQDDNINLFHGRLVLVKR